MRWIPGARLFRVGGRPQEPAESSELTLLLVKISSNADGGNNGSRLLDELISTAHRPRTAGPSGNMELRMLRESPGNQRIARAAADVVLERAYADPAFGAALDTWRRKEQVREYLGPPAGEAGSKQDKKNRTERSTGRRFLIWASAAISTAATALVVTFTVGIPGDVNNLRSNLGQPVMVKVLPGPSAGLFEALPEPVVLAGKQMAGLTSSQWLAGHGAVAVRDLYVELIVTGRRSSGVQIVNIQPMTSCHSALAGTILDFPGQGAVTNTQLVYNLVNPLAPPSYVVGLGGAAEKNYFQHYTVSLKKGEQFTFLIHAYMYTAEYCRFSLNMAVNDGGRIVDQKINNNGAPFAITGTCAAASRLPFSCYHDAYLGGPEAAYVDPSLADQPGMPWIKVNPETYSP